MDGICVNVMMEFWMIAGNAINRMYERTKATKKGIG